MPSQNTKTCEQCGISFVTQKRDAKYCSQACAGLARRTQLTVTCERCGASFTAKASWRAKGRARFCSKQCAYLSARTVPDAKCRTCGKVYRPYDATNGQVYCSFDCRNQYIAALPQADKEALMAGCRTATRGAKHSDEHRRKIAMTRQERLALSGDEAEIMAAYEGAGLRPIPLYAFDRYNIDFAFPEQKLAVEYDGGNWHNTPEKIAIDERKAAFLQEQGWQLLRFPRLDKPQDNTAGNRRIAVGDIVRQTQEALRR